MRVPRPLSPGTTRSAQTSISIAAAPAPVWKMIAAIDTIAEWYDDWDGVRHDVQAPHLELNASFQLFRRRPGRPEETALCRVTTLSAAKDLAWLQSSPGSPDVTVAFVLVPNADGSETELQHTRVWAGP